MKLSIKKVGLKLKINDLELDKLSKNIAEVNNLLDKFVSLDKDETLKQD